METQRISLTLFFIEAEEVRSPVFPHMQKVALNIISEK